MRELSPWARAYLVGVYLLGLGATASLVFGVREIAQPEDWLLAAGLAAFGAVTQVFGVARRGSYQPDYLTSAPLFAAFLLLPPPLLALTVCLTFLPEWIGQGRKWFTRNFKTASWLTAAAGGRWALLLLTGHSQLGRGVPLPPAAILLAMLVVLSGQTLLLALALKLTHRQTFRETGLVAPPRLLVEAGLLCSGWAFATAWVADPLYGIAAAVPLALIFQALHVPNLREEASTDPKTGLANQRHFNAMMDRELSRAERSRQDVSLLMCDLDNLRLINNTCGHQAGDVVLLGIADSIRRNIRGCDIAGRFGGDEFVVLLADADGAEARRVADRIRHSIVDLRFPIDGGDQVIGATVSIGVATFPGDGRTQEVLLREADLAVYQAKREGRNRVAVAGRTSREFAADRARERGMSDPETAAPTPPRSTLWRTIADAAGFSASGQGLPVAAAVPDGAGVRGQRHVAEPRPGLPRRVQAFIGVVAAAGLLGLAWPIAARWPLPPVSWDALAFFAALTIVAEQLAVDVDRRGKTSVSVVAILGAALLYDELGILVTVFAFALWAKLRSHSPINRMLFNFGNALLAAEGASWAFRLLVGRPIRSVPFEQMVLPAVAAGLAYYVVNHALLCIVRGLAERRRPWEIWLADYQWLWRHYAVLGALGLIVALGHMAFGWAGVVALTAPVGMMHLAIKQYIERTAVYVDELRRMNARLSDSHEATLLALTRALDTRNEETEEHSQRVKRYSELIGRQLGVPDEELEHISRGALLHDIGKIGVPDAILLKPGRLTEEEFAQIRKHPAIGYSMISHIPFLTRAADVVLYHHEAYNGSGYPGGLAGEAIPLGARIFSVADSFDAMTSDRPYRKALSYEVACAEILRCRGKQFDPGVVDAFLAIPAEELQAIGQAVYTPAQSLAPLLSRELQPAVA